MRPASWIVSSSQPGGASCRSDLRSQGSSRPNTSTPYASPRPAAERAGDTASPCPGFDSTGAVQSPLPRGNSALTLGKFTVTTRGLIAHDLLERIEMPRTSTLRQSSPMLARSTTTATTRLRRTVERFGAGAGPRIRHTGAFGLVTARGRGRTKRSLPASARRPTHIRLDRDPNRW
jgi:hypothetical protein